MEWGLDLNIGGSKALLEDTKKDYKKKKNHKISVKKKK